MPLKDKKKKQVTRVVRKGNKLYIYYYGKKYLVEDDVKDSDFKGEVSQILKYIKAIKKKRKTAGKKRTPKVKVDPNKPLNAPKPVATGSSFSEAIKASDQNDQKMKLEKENKERADKKDAEEKERLRLERNDQLVLRREELDLKKQELDEKKYGAIRAREAELLRITNEANNVVALRDQAAVDLDRIQFSYEEVTNLLERAQELQEFQREQSELQRQQLEEDIFRTDTELRNLKRDYKQGVAEYRKRQEEIQKLVEEKNKLQREISDKLETIDKQTNEIDKLNHCFMS